MPETTPATPKKSGTSRFIVVFGTKGGVGKTVVVTNLAASLAKRTKKSVCVIDLDIMAMGDVAKMLSISPTGTIADLMPVLKRAVSPELIPFDGCLMHHAAGVDLLQCLADPRQLGQIDPKALPTLFDVLKQRYDYVIVDGGRAFSEPLLAAFDASNLILLVTSPEVISLYQTKASLGLLEGLLFPASMVKAIVNRAESRGAVERQEVLATVGCEVIGEIPSDGRTVGTATNQGVPIPVEFGHTKVADAFTKLAETLATKSNLYIAHSEVPKRPDGAVPVVTPGTAMLSSRVYTPADAEAAKPDQALDEMVMMKRRVHAQLVEELNLKRVDLTAMTNPNEMRMLRTRTEGVIANLLAKEMGGLTSSHELRQALVNEIADEALGLGPLEELLHDDTVTDILVNNRNQIYVERGGKLEATDKKFISDDQLRAVIERIVTPLGRRIDESSPMVDARLPDGSRVNAIIPPLALKGPSLSIRKFSIHQYTADDLVRINSLNANMAAFIRACVIARKNIIVSGGTGSGKTTMLNIVSAFIPHNERIVTIEDAAELRLVQPHWVSLEARPPSVEGKGLVTIRDLFRNSLRMRPDRIVIGECRGAESLDMLQAMNTGHDGSLTTIHANSPRDVIRRLDSMVLMSNIDLPILAVRQMVSSAIDLVVHTARFSDGSRRVTAISEVEGLAVGGTEVTLRDLFLFEQSGVSVDGTVKGRFVTTGQQPSFLKELRSKGVTMDDALFTKTDA